MKVFLHVGAGKTGTSAIQAALARGRDSLARHGVFYPVPPPEMEDRAPQGEVSSGNARALGWYCNPNLAGRGLTREGVRAWVEAGIRDAAGRDLLYSSESLQFASPTEAAEILEIFGRAGYAPQVVYYVRHVLDHAISEFLQHLKFGFTRLPRREAVNTLPSYIREHRSPFLRSIRIFAGLVPREALQIRLYDAERQELVPRFLALLGLDPSDVETGEDKLVNRSLAPEEVPIFERLAAEPDGGRLCRLMTDLIAHTPAPSKAPFMVDPEDFALFTRHNQPMVDEINAHWLPAESRLLIRSDRVPVGAVPPLTVEAVTGAAAGSVAALLRSLIEHRARQRQAPLREERRAARQRALGQDQGQGQGQGQARERPRRPPPA